MSADTKPDPGRAQTRSSADEIVTARLRLVPLRSSDLDDLAQMYADPMVMLGSSGMAVPRTKDESADWLAAALAGRRARFHQTFKVEDRQSGDFLGRCGLRPDADGPDTEIAYAFVRAAWGRGIATEAAGAVIGWGVAEGLERLVACVLAGNVASQRVLAKVGMRRSGKQNTPDGWSLALFEWDRAAP